MKIMNEFIIDLTELFKKHRIIVQEDSVELLTTPLHYDSLSKLSRRDLVFKFTEIVEDNYAANEHAKQYGFIID